MTAPEKPETPRSVEEIAQELSSLQFRSDFPHDVTEAIAAALRAEREARAEQRMREYETAQREDEDAACRLEELRAKFGIVGGTAEEIVGAVGLCLDMLMENQERNVERVRVLEEALREIARLNGCSCDDHAHLTGNPRCSMVIARRALAPAQEAK